MECDGCRLGVAANPLAQIKSSCLVGSCTSPFRQLAEDRKSTRLNSSHTEIYTLSLHDALPIYGVRRLQAWGCRQSAGANQVILPCGFMHQPVSPTSGRSEEYTSELQSHRDLHSFPTRRSSDLWSATAAGLGLPPIRWRKSSHLALWVHAPARFAN